MGGGRLAAMRRLGQSSTAAGAVSGIALAPRFAPVVVVQVGAPPPSLESARDASARRIDGGGLLGGSGSIGAKSARGSHYL
jgi:hypothetical protein